MSMRLLIMLPSTIRGGAEGYSFTIAVAAVKQGWDVHVAFPKAEGTATLVEDFITNGVSYHPLDIREVNLSSLSAVQKHFRQCASTINLIKKLQPDVVKITLPWPNKCFGSIIACALLQIPTAVVFQLLPLEFSFSKSRLAIYHWAKNRKQQWIAISEHNRKLVAEFFQIPINQVLRIYNGTNSQSNLINCDKEEIHQLRQQVRQELGLSQNSKLLLTVGRLDPQKGYETIIPVIKPIVEQFPDVRFVWVGEGQQRELLMQKLQECGVADKVLLLGFRKDVSKLLTTADLFVFPSLYEGLPFALIEAIAHKLPAIASDASSIPEVITNHQHGLLFKTADSQALLSAIRWALHHPEATATMAENAQHRTQDFCAEKMIVETLTVLQSLSKSA